MDSSFANDGHLAVFDIQLKKKFTNSTKNIGYKKYFYEVHPFFINYFFNLNVEAGRQFVDDCIRAYNEDLLAPFIKQFENLRTDFEMHKDKNPYYIAHIDNKSVVDFFLLQYFRTVKFGEEFKPAAKIVVAKTKAQKIEKLVRPDRVQDELQSIFLLIALTKLHYGPKDISYKEAPSGFTEYIGIIEKLKEQIDSCKKVIVVTSSANQFVTSDNPAVIKWVDKEKTEFSIGYVPINPGVGIAFINKSHHKTYNDPLQEIRLVDERDHYKIVQNLNCLLVRECNRFIYAYDDRHFYYIKDYVEGKFAINLIL